MGELDLATQIAKGLTFAAGSVLIMRLAYSRGKYAAFGEKLGVLLKYLVGALVVATLFLGGRQFLEKGTLSLASPGPVREDKARGGIDLTDAGAKGKLQFVTPRDVMTSMRRWFPDWRNERLVRGEVLPAITKEWPSESVAFYVVWSCWPESTSWTPNADPLLWSGPRYRKYPDLSACAAQTVADLAHKMNANEQGTALAGARDLLRLRLAAAARKSTCQETGADDCVLLLAQLAALAPLDRTLAQHLPRIEALLKDSPEKYHQNRQLALVKVRTAMALASLAGEPKASLLADWIDRAEAWGPALTSQIRRAAGAAPFELAMSQAAIKEALAGALSTELSVRAIDAQTQRSGTACCRYSQRTPLWPLGYIEDAPPPVRKNAIDILAGEVVRLASDKSCDRRFMEGLDGDADLVGNDRYVLMHQLSFLYSATRALSGEATRCAAVTLPPHGRKEPWLVDVPAKVGELIGNEERPWAHYQGELLLEGICAGDSGNSACNKLPKGELDHQSLNANASFVRKNLAQPGDLAALVPVATAKAIENVLEGLNCRLSKAEVWTSSSSEAALIAPDCDLHRPAHEDNLARPLDDGRSQLLVAYGNGRAHRLLVLGSFMYDDEGTLIDVSDVDGDERLELWLRGPVAECDSDDTSQPCEAEGTSYGEDFGGILGRFRDDR